MAKQIKKNLGHRNHPQIKVLIGCAFEQNSYYSPQRTTPNWEKVALLNATCCL